MSTRPAFHDITRADLQEEFDEHALVEGYFERDDDEPDDFEYEEVDLGDDT